MCYKILQLHLSKNIFFLRFASYTRSGTFGVILVKHSQIHLGIKNSLKTSIFSIVTKSLKGVEVRVGALVSLLEGYIFFIFCDGKSTSFFALYFKGYYFFPLIYRKNS